MLALALSGCAQAPRASDADSDITLPDDRPLRATAPVDMLRSTAPTPPPPLPPAPPPPPPPPSPPPPTSPTTPPPPPPTLTGYEEQLQLTVYYLRSGRVQ